ncbi:hypothetical protein NQ315_005687 [Exocentrus adspersus]|uniref:DDE Tnp4 domain-containing protein n=1 Tax=Exocentrus adspersus TaxID=1586481 RepID=A0AAV8VID0_9CUCU|nr:hypothetical protein NQ315_005687 [Exocentrus adspersus]
MNRRGYVQLELEKRRRMNNVLLLSLLLITRRKNKRTPKRFWIRDIFKKRQQQGAYHNLLNEMRLTDTEKYFNYLRMSSENFNNLLNIVGPKLFKIHCVREPISIGERLALTLRYLASGDSMVSISYAFRIAPTTITHIIYETCNAIWDCLADSVLLKPDEESWLNIAKEFEERWQLPHCVGAIDGKHVSIQAPAHSGSTYYNYKGSHSIVLLALCDARYKFTLVDIGSEGRHSDGGIFKNSNIGKRILENQMKFPAPSAFTENGDPFNYYIAADEAFPLSTCIMRPYPGSFFVTN